MLIALWITAILLTLAYLGAGGTKVVRKHEALREVMPWTTHASTVQVKVVGTLELLGALGVILPLVTGIAPVVTAIAAVCLALVQVVAIGIHIRLHDVKSLPANVLLLLLAVAVAVLRALTL